MVSKSRARTGGRPGRIPARETAAHDAQLVEAASRVFRQHGYAGTSIDMLAAAAQASPKTIYARYGGKLGLFTAVIERMTGSPVATWEGLKVDSDPERELSRAANRFLGLVLSPDVLEMERAVIAEATRLPELANVFYARGPRRGLEALRSYLAAQHERGSLYVTDAALTAELFVNMLEGEVVRRALLLGERATDRERRNWAAFAVGKLLKICTPDQSDGAKVKG